MANIVLTCKGDYIVSYEEADELVIYDMDSKKIVYRLKKPKDPMLLEDILEDHDPWVLFSESAPPEIAELIRDIGIKVQFVRKRKFSEFINEVIG